MWTLSTNAGQSWKESNDAAVRECREQEKNPITE
jgi:hypothetical protein